uniref:Uncharacterized protein n=1 Tax=Spongospora subterranea TaxID=70186 RepID=A0A0H5QS30_9EUKA|eukprot:CRZ04823.1 hypothetical protein [Spongospora subterranea]
MNRNGVPIIFDSSGNDIATLKNASLIISTTSLFNCRSWVMVISDRELSTTNQRHRALWQQSLEQRLPSDSHPDKSNPGCSPKGNIEKTRSAIDAIIKSGTRQ